MKWTTALLTIGSFAALIVIRYAVRISRTSNPSKERKTQEHEMTTKAYSYKIDVVMVDPVFDSPILELFETLSEEAKRLEDTVYRNKALAVNMKWSGVSFLRAEIKTLDRMYAASSVIRLLDKSLIITKIETYLSTSRAILDILAYCLTKSLELGGYDKSFNDVRKRKDLPSWLAHSLEVAMQFDPDKSISENGWLLNLVSDPDIHGPCLRDFVTHGGTIDLEGIEQFDGEYRFGFRRRLSDKFHYHIEDMVDNVHQGMCVLFDLVYRNLKQQ